MATSYRTSYFFIPESKAQLALGVSRLYAYSFKLVEFAYRSTFSNMSFQQRNLILVFFTRSDSYLSSRSDAWLLKQNYYYLPKEHEIVVCFVDFHVVTVCVSC